MPNGLKPISHEENSSSPLRLDLPISGTAEVVPVVQTPDAAPVETTRAFRGKAPQSDSAKKSFE